MLRSVGFIVVFLILFLSSQAFAEVSEGLEKEVKDIITKLGIKMGSNLSAEQRISLEKSMTELLSKGKRSDEDKVAIYTMLLQVFINEDPKKAVDYLDKLSELKKDNDDNYLQFQQVKAYLLGVPLGNLKAAREVLSNVRIRLKDYKEGIVETYLTEVQILTANNLIDEAKGVIKEVEKLNKDQATELLKEISMIGMDAPTESLTDPDDKTFSLSDFKGKYVVLDFWATWCGPCVSEIPNMKETYEKFKDKGVVIVSISLDKNKEAWKKMIKDKGMVWYHTNIPWEPENKILKLFNVTAIPSVFIIDPNGKIAAMGLRGEMIGKRLEEFLNKGNK